MISEVLSVFAIICVALILGKIAAKVRLPAILGWLVAGIVFGPYLAGVVSMDILNSYWYKIAVKAFECFAGVMIGKEIIFKKLASSGKQIIGITFIQSIGTFLFVSLVFALVFLCLDIPVYLSFVFGGIALATAPAPALSIVNEYRTEGPVTRTLIPLAAIDDVIGVVVFFTVISIVGSSKGGNSQSLLAVIASVCLPFVIGISAGFLAALLIRKIKDKRINFIFLLFFLCLCTAIGIAVDVLVFKSFRLNYILIGMAFSAALVNLIPRDKAEDVFELYQGILNISLVLVIVNLGMPLDYRLISGAGLFTVIYILSRAIGKIGSAFVGGKITKSPPSVTKYLGFTLLPHSGVSLVFTGIAVTTLNGIDTSLSEIVQGTIVAAAIINEIIAVIAAKYAFIWAGEVRQEK